MQEKDIESGKGGIFEREMSRKGFLALAASALPALFLAKMLSKGSGKGRPLGSDRPSYGNYPYGGGE